MGVLDVAEAPSEFFRPISSESAATRDDSESFVRFPFASPPRHNVPFRLPIDIIGLKDIE